MIVDLMSLILYPLHRLIHSLTYSKTIYCTHEIFHLKQQSSDLVFIISILLHEETGLEILTDKLIQLLSLEFDLNFG